METIIPNQMSRMTKEVNQLQKRNFYYNYKKLKSYLKRRDKLIISSRIRICYYNKINNKHSNHNNKYNKTNIKNKIYQRKV